MYIYDFDCVVEEAACWKDVHTYECVGWTRHVFPEYDHKVLPVYVKRLPEFLNGSSDECSVLFSEVHNVTCSQIQITFTRMLMLFIIISLTHIKL